MAKIRPQREGVGFIFPEEMSGLPELVRASDEQMALERAILAEYMDGSCPLTAPKFSGICRKDLRVFFSDRQAIDHIEAAVRLGDYANKEDQNSTRKAVSNLQKKAGSALPRGKRGSKPEPPKIPSADQRGLSLARSMG